MALRQQSQAEFRSSFLFSSDLIEPALVEVAVTPDFQKSSLTVVELPIDAKNEEEEMILPDSRVVESGDMFARASDMQFSNFVDEIEDDPENLDEIVRSNRWEEPVVEEIESFVAGIDDEVEVVAVLTRRSLA